MAYQLRNIRSVLNGCLKVGLKLQTSDIIQPYCSIIKDLESSEIFTVTVKVILKTVKHLSYQVGPKLPAVGSFALLDTFMHSWLEKRSFCDTQLSRILDFWRLKIKKNLTS